MVKVFYHNDPDGWCSAFWVRKHLENEGIPFTESDFIEMNYDKEFPWEILTSGEQVFIVDFSIEPTQMAELMAITVGIGNITWIDHHKTAIEKYKDFPVPIKGFRQDDVAACMLTWAYFEFKWDRPIDINIGIPTIGDHVIQLSPQFTQYIHLWDTWQWKSDIHANKIEAFITGLQGKDLHPCSDIWGELNDDEILAPECNDIPEGDLLLGSIIDQLPHPAYARMGLEE